MGPGEFGATARGRAPAGPNHRADPVVYLCVRHFARIAYEVRTHRAHALAACSSARSC
ncbi:hypothetical protein BSFP_008300 [Burkholderia stabilis]|uniref:Uncharacterized protein n=1 Tax=Burkholderia stabilis TaxID=95485 RepID=A0A1Y1BE05_9BURK|nr:hypothetical protein BSFP_008300 [Burkholderia stabilis]